MAKNLSIERKVKLKSLVKTAKNEVSTVNEGGDFFSVGTIFQFDGHLHKILFAHLPSAPYPGHSSGCLALEH
jgi:hypothetical protein